MTDGGANLHRDWTGHDDREAAMTDDIQVDTPLGKTVGEVEQSVTGIEVFGPMGDQTILALCAALREERTKNKRLWTVLQDYTEWQAGTGLIPAVKPPHGSCCTCQGCGRAHDECVCEHNKIQEFLFPGQEASDG